MLTETRTALSTAVEALALTTGTGEPVEIWDRLPDDVNALPCVVVGLPRATPSIEAGVVFNCSTIVYAIGRRVDADDPEGELTTLADALFDGLGGTRGMRAGGDHFVIETIAPQIIAVAGIDHDAYLLTVDSPRATC